VVAEVIVDNGPMSRVVLLELEPCEREWEGEWEREGREEEVVSEVVVDNGLISRDVLLLELEPC
jgi:hypothetical protein